MSYMLDTDICIRMIRQRPDGLLQRVTQYAIGEVAVSSITVAELEYGVYRSRQPVQNAAALAQFLLPLAVLSFDEAAADSYGRIRAHLEAQGIPIGSLDTLIAAHALSVRATLITHNTREFARVPDLNVEDWSE